VIVVEPQSQPMLRQFGPVIGELVRRAHEERGTEFRLGVGVRDIEALPDGRTLVHVDDGAAITADVVVAAVGSVCDTDWLAGSGLRLGDGVGSDADCRAADRVYVAGDIASWRDPLTGEARRFEHRMNATEMGRSAALNLLGTGEKLRPTRYFWSDQHGFRIQAVGAFPSDGTLDVVSGSVSDGRFVATLSRDGAVVGVLGWNAARDFTRWRASIGGAQVAKAVSQ
jgi:NADPH-dependent 2,4-dienoyl-CoA reductase/sulfur reductase-like enzyme